MSDMTGEYRLAAGEEVVSNLHGQADQFRPILAAINSAAWRDALGQIKRPKQNEETGDE